MNHLIRTILIALAAGFLGAFFACFWFYSEWKKQQTEQSAMTLTGFGDYSPSEPIPAANSTPTDKSDTAPTATGITERTDFTLAAAKCIPSVVYINSISKSGASYSIYDMLFGNSGQQTQVSSGSGVIYAQDGYIVTNNHVVETAEQIEVVWNKKVYPAELIGTDPSTDLAVLKIKETGLPAISLGSSAALGVGEWVVAVGNPFSLTSTVTVGIVSAKGRSINVVADRFPIESFIQTDAAINPGNSGGALVNRDGLLVGINTAILSRTGSYTGYAFAVPVDIVRKVVGDLIRFGVHQKAVFGCDVVEYDERNATKYGLPTDVSVFKGVLVSEVASSGAARKAGIQAGDIIIKINETEINSRSAFEEELSYRSPGDQISITYTRQGQLGTVVVTLLNRNGESSVIRRKIYSDGTLGANLEATEVGVKVFKIKNGLFGRLGIPENYTIVSINRKRVRDPQEVIDFFERYKGRVLIYGVNSSRQEYPLQFILQ